jgi:hypothetical protein
MRLSLRTILLGGFASALLVLAPYSTPPAHAIPAEVQLNASNVQVVQNPGQTDVLNMSLIVTDRGDGPIEDLCDGEKDDLLETGVHVGVYVGTCANFFSLCFGIAGCPTLPFSYFVNPYVEHDIGSTSYGTFFGLNGPGTVASKIVALATPPGACGRWRINLQATGLDLSSITSSPMALLLNDSDNIFPICDDVAVKIGNGIVKSAQGAHSVRH